MIFSRYRKFLLAGCMLIALVFFAAPYVAMAQGVDEAEESIGKILCIPEKNSDGNDLYICINRLYKFTLAIGGIGAVTMIVFADRKSVV